MYASVPLTCSALRGQKRELDPPELELALSAAMEVLEIEPSSSGRTTSILNPSHLSSFTFIFLEGVSSMGN